MALEHPGGRLRDFLRWIVERGEPVYGLSIPVVVDVDRAEDVELAEALVERLSLDADAPQGGIVVNPHGCWGVFRERTHSPGRESDDTEILRLTGKMLEARGFDVSVKSHEELLDSRDAPPPSLFVMCEQLPSLRRLQVCEAAGARVVNRPLAILNTYRERTLPRWKAAGVAFPPSRVVPTGRSAPGDLGLRASSYPVWVKRADVHYLEAGDVTRASTAEAVETALARTRRTGNLARGAPGSRRRGSPEILRNRKRRGARRHTIALRSMVSLLLSARA